MMRAETEAKRLSRRRFVAFGAASAAITGSGWAQSIAAQPPGSPADEAARIAAGNDSAEHMTVPVMINGRGPFRFVVDTGADRSVLAEDVAVTLGLVRGNQVSVQGVVRSVSTRVVGVSEISFGSLTKRNLSMPLLSRTYMGADGYLGLDAVDGSRVTLDFANRALKIANSRIPSGFNVRRPNEAFVPVRGNMGHLRSLNCRVDGVGATCFLDTGAQISVGNSRLLEALLRDDPNTRTLGMLPITGITGGVVMGQVVQVGTIRLHSVNFSNAVVAIADMQIFDVWGLASQPSLLIGMNFLRQFAQVSIDYGMKEIRFDLASMLLARNG
jgi:predicted aspartyl protease